MPNQSITIELPDSAIDKIDDNEIEIVKLQQSLLKDVTAERDRLARQVNTLVEQASQHEIEVISYETQLDSLTGRIGELIDAQMALESRVSDSINLDKYKQLEAQFDDVALKLDVNKKTLANVIATNRELERRMADTSFKAGVANSDKSDLEEELTKLKKDHAYLVQQHKTANHVITDYKKQIRDLELDVKGFPVRMENACKAAVKQFQDSHQHQLQASSRGDKDHIVNLERSLNEERSKALELNQQVDALNEQLSTMSDDFKECMDLVQLSHENVNAMEAQYKRMKGENEKHKSYGKQCVELVASMQSDHVREQRDNIYLGHILEYFGGKALYADPDGTTVFMISSDLSAKVSVVGDGTPAETPHPKYPLFWVAHQNGLGHMAMISIDEQNLILPENLAKKYLVNTKHWDGILNAIRGNTLQEYQRALDEATTVAQNLSKQAEYFDYDFAQTFDRAKFIKAGFDCGAWNQEKLKSMEDDFYMLNTLAKRYRVRHKTVTNILQRRKNIKRKGKK
ncbi:hypothetical protein [Photobacterium leiognathi]|uniref:hypothetical protein n=1 Tax=Photobacterium leiognathi TaxID=553611 RepID=UPI00298172A0|nr:hypothetical protein [Photobacterium leiognathi]